MSGLRLRHINCGCGAKSLVTYKVTKKAIYAEKACKCHDNIWLSYQRKDAVDAKIPIAPRAWRLN